MIELTTTIPPMRDTILGVILAGGGARRMGGGDKGLVDLGGQPMLAHVIARFRPQVGHLILNANGDPARFTTFGLDVVADLTPANQGLQTDQGPIAGILAAMAWAEKNDSHFAAISTVSTDVPFLPRDCVRRLHEASRSHGGNRPAIAVSGGRRHPTVALWPLSLKSEVAASLARNDLRVNVLADTLGAIEVSFLFSESAGQPIDPFYNTNTPEDLATARRILSGQT